MSKIDLNRVWDDAKGMGMANRDLLAAISGMFVLLPFVIVVHFMTMPDGKLGAHPSEEALAGLYRTFIEANWPLFLGWTVLSCFGSLAMLVLLLRHERPTVAESLKGAIFILPSFFVAYVLRYIALEVGFFLLVLPALYLFGRFILIASVAAAEQEYNPITIIQRSFLLTRGNGVRIVFLFLILLATTVVVLMVLAALIGLIGTLFLAPDIAQLVNSIVVGLIVAAFEATVALLSAAIYRAATAPSPTPWMPGAGG